MMEVKGREILCTRADDLSLHILCMFFSQGDGRGRGWGLFIMLTSQCIVYPMFSHITGI